jgi:hypothetical protein
MAVALRRCTGGKLKSPELGVTGTQSTPKRLPAGAAGPAATTPSPLAADRLLLVACCRKTDNTLAWFYSTERKLPPECLENGNRELKAAPEKQRTQELKEAGRSGCI